MSGAPATGLRMLLLLASLFSLSACVEQTIPIGGLEEVDEGAGATVPPPPGQLLFSGYGLKSLSFIWAKVEQTSFYRILEQPGPGAGFSDISGVIDGIGDGPFSYTATLRLHLTDWSNGKYMFEACNAQGCTGSDDTLDVSPSDSVSMIGYMKPLDPAAFSQFGYAMAYSADGGTLAVGTCPQGIIADTGSVYLFTNTGAEWVQQAKLNGSREAGNYGFGCAVALSGAGDVLAVGAVGDSSSLTGVDPVGGDLAAPNSGAVYVFRRTDGLWAEEAYIKASNTGANDGFGRALGLAGDGATLAVGASSEDSDATGVFTVLPHGTEDNNAAVDSGAVYLFTRDDTAGWGQQAYIKAVNAQGGDRFGIAVALADSGATLAVGANGEDSAGFGANDDCGSAQAQDNCLSDSGAVYVFTRAAGEWNAQAFLKAQTPGQEDGFGSALALSTDGGVLAVGAPLEDSAATGVGGNAVNDCDLAEDARVNCSLNSGAAYLFSRSGSQWDQDAYVKASNTEAGVCVGGTTSSCDEFGTSVALSGDGAVLVVGAPREDSFVSGINVPPASVSRRNSNRNSGAAYVYRNQAFFAILKSSAGERATTDDGFGFSLALSEDGTKLAVGDIGNDCPFTGVAGKPVYSGLTNNQMQPDLGLCGTPAESGAVYLF
ncbi:MAG: integrin [Gammaproteobacteria bacterium]|nr:integrin [Gammaproteobacteria bacterium]